MADKVENPAVDLNEQGEVVVKHPDLHPDAGTGQLALTAEQAKALARALFQRAEKADRDRKAKEQETIRNSVRTLGFKWPQKA